MALDSAVNIAFPAMSAALGAPVGAIQWVVIAYVLTDACLLLPAGQLADRRGHRRVFVTGLAVTGAAFLACGGAPGLGTLLAARVLQGIGAALVLGSAPALVTLASAEPARRRALGWYNLAFGVGGVVGPLAGGVLVARWGWRAVYLARVPIAALALVLAWRSLPGDPAPAAHPGASRLPDAIADRRAFLLANAVNFLANVAAFAVWLLVPYYLLDQRGLGAGPAGLLFAVGALATSLGAPIGARCADRWGARGLVPGALAVEALGLYLASGLDAGSRPETVALALALFGGGFGVFLVPNMHDVMAALPPARQGWAGSLVVLMRRVGVIAGAQVAAGVYGWRLAAASLPGQPNTAAAALAFAAALQVAAGVAVLAAALALVPPRRSRA